MKRNNMKSLPIVFIMALPSIFGCAFPTNILNSAIVTVNVVDEDGNTVPGVRSEFYNQTDSHDDSGVTDKDGIYATRVWNASNEIGGVFTKPGYYKSIGRIWKKTQEEPVSNNNFTVVLKRIIDPVKMHKKAKQVTISPQYTILPRLYESVGYDLEIGDWVFPDGKGKITDMLITTDGHFTNNQDFSLEMTVEFTGELNGIQPFNYPVNAAGMPLRSELPPPAVAPENNYVKIIKMTSRRTPPEKWSVNSYDETRKWIFRTRTTVDENGEIVSAHYGWTTEDINFGIFNEQGLLTFFYYYNPDPHSRSLEPKEIADRQNRD